jgi:hypothetical protein
MDHSSYSHIVAPDLVAKLFLSLTPPYVTAPINNNAIKTVEGHVLLGSNVLIINRDFPFNFIQSTPAHYD